MSDLPPVAQISASRFGGKTFANEQVITIQSTSTTRLANNPNRVRVVLLNEGLYDVRVSNLPNISTTSGFVLAASGGTISFDWEQDGESVTYEIYLLAVSNTSDVRIREVIRL